MSKETNKIFRVPLLHHGIAMFNVFSSNVVLLEDKLSFQWLVRRKKILHGLQQTRYGNKK